MAREMVLRTSTLYLVPLLAYERALGQQHSVSLMEAWKEQMCAVQTRVSQNCRTDA